MNNAEDDGDDDDEDDLMGMKGEFMNVWNVHLMRAEKGRKENEKADDERCNWNLIN